MKLHLSPLVGLWLICVAPQLVATTIFVSPQGADGNDGRAWAAAKRSIGSALALANSGDEIRVAGGLYLERIELKAGVALYGGWEGAGDVRNPGLFPSILDGQKAGCVVQCQTPGVSETTRLDGFIVQHGQGIMKGGILVVGGNPVIANNIIRQNLSEGEGGGICCFQGASPLILNNLIHDNTAHGPNGDGGGICAMPTRRVGEPGEVIERLPSSPRIVGNRIFHNVAYQNGGGLCAKGGSEPVIQGNQILLNLASVEPSYETWRFEGLDDNGDPHQVLGERPSVGAGGVALVEHGGGILRDNLIAGNGGMHGGGLLLYDTAPGVQVINNTLSGNSPGGVRWMNCSPLLVNNLIHGNGVGVSRSLLAPGEPPVFRHNCVFGNAIDFDGFANPGYAGGNLPVEPFLAQPRFGNYHLQPASPLVDAGDPGFLQSGETDAFGRPRQLGRSVDIGADESEGSLWKEVAPVIRVKPEGNDNADGSNWTLAMRTLAAAIAAAETMGGAEIWVAQGRYAEAGLAVRPYVYLYGGFAGNEFQLTPRSPAAHPTILDGNGQNFVIRLVGGYRLSALDGFTVTGGRQTGTFAQSGGISIVAAGPLIENNLISGNNAPLGAGLGLYCATATIRNNLVVSNTAAADGKGWGAGLHATHSTPFITRNDFHHNTGSEGGGLYFTASKPWVLANLIHDNQGSGVQLENARNAAWLNADATVVAQNLIYRNYTSGSGGGIHVKFVAGHIANNLVVFNATGGTQGGGLWITHGTDIDGLLVVANNTIIGNRLNYLLPWGLVFQGAGIFTYLLGQPTVVLSHNIVAGNDSGVFNLRGDFAPVSPVLVRNCVWGNSQDGWTMQNHQTDYLQAGPLNHPTDLSVNPGFVDGENFDFHLAPGSPCVDAGATETAADSDVEGLPRPLDGNDDGAALPDLGAFERWKSGDIAPTQVTASQGDFPHQVRVTWKPVALANRYEVWRAEEGSSEPLALLVTLEGSDTIELDDTAVSPGIRYRYSVTPKLERLEVAMDWSGGDANYRFNPSSLVAPISLAAIGFAQPPVTPIENWRQQHFTEAERVNPAISGDAADPDGDQLVNLGEYVTGSDPRQPENVGVFTAVLRENAGAVYLVLTVREARPKTSDAGWAVEFSPNLKPGTWATQDIIILNTTEQTGFALVSGQIPAAIRPGECGFLRLRFERR